MKVLLVRFAAMGDCVMTAWAATAIRERYPEATLVWAVEKRCQDIVDTGRLANELIVFPRERWKQGRWSPAIWLEQVRHYLSFRNHGYDLGFDMQGHSKTALCLRLARPRRRIAAFATDSLARRLNPLAGAVPSGTHMVEWQVQVLNRLGEFAMPKRPLMPSVRRLASERRRAVIAVGAGQPDKTVSSDTWRTVGELLRDEGWEVTYLGGPGESFACPFGTTSLVGKTSVPELSSWIASSDLLLAGDTGAGHLAAAYGTPVVTVFGANDPRFYRPYTERGRVLKRGTGVADFTATEIVREAKELLGDGWPSGS